MSFPRLQSPDIVPFFDCVIHNNEHWGACFYCWHFFYQLLEINPHRDSLYPVVKFHPSNLIQHKYFTFSNTVNCEFSQHFFFYYSRAKKKRYGGSPILHGEAIWPPFMPPQAAECCSNKSPDVPLIFFLILWILFTSYCFFSLYKNAALWLAERSLPACLWTACVPRACPRRRSFSFLNFSSCLPPCLSLH